MTASCQNDIVFDAPLENTACVLSRDGKNNRIGGVSMGKNIVRFHEPLVLVGST